MNSRQRTNLIFIVLVVIAVVAVLCTRAYATPPDNRPPDNRPPNQESVNVNSNQSSNTAYSLSQAGADASASADATGGTSAAEATGGTASAQGGNVTVNDGGTSFNSESSNTNVVLVPNNNTAGCMRVYGLSFGNGDGAGGLGLPFRDKACDYEQAADDAAAAGEHDIAWFWRCHKKNLYKPYKDSGETDEQAVGQCYTAMRQMLGFEDTRARLDSIEHSQILLAELSDEEAAELKAKIAALEAELAEREAKIEEYEQTQEQIQQQQQQQIQQNDELLNELRKDAERRRKALAALEKKEA